MRAQELEGLIFKNQPQSDAPLDGKNRNTNTHTHTLATWILFTKIWTVAVGGGGGRKNILLPILNFPPYLPCPQNFIG